MKRYLFQFVALLFVAGCATTTPEVSTYIDPVMGNRTDLLSDNELKTPGQPRELVWLNASRMFKSDFESQYYLEVSYMARKEVGYLDILPGETLTIVADGKSMKFDGSGSLNTRKPYKKELVRENAIFPTTKTALQRIASAKEVKVLIKGKNGLIEREFAQDNFDRFRKFVSSFAQ